MSLENYLVTSSVFSEEIRWEFSQEEQQQLHSQLRALGRAKYQAWVRKNLEDILKYIGLPPSRRKAKKWTSRPDYLLLRAAALQISDVAEEFRSEIVDIAYVVDRGSYREFHAIIAQVLARAVIDPQIFENPFGGTP